MYIKLIKILKYLVYSMFNVGFVWNYIYGI